MSLPPALVALPCAARLPPPQRGAVLVLVLWTVALLTLVLGAFLATTRVETGIAADTVSRVRLRAAAEGVINYLAVYRGQSETGLEELLGPTLYWDWNGEAIRFRLLPETAFVSLNGAPVELLRDLLSNLGVQQDDAAALAAAVIDWRDPDEDPVEGGAEAPEYQALGLDYAPNNRPFGNLYELQQVRGFSVDLVERLAPLVTVYGTHRGVNPLFASPELLALLAVDAAMLPDTAGTAREDATDDMGDNPYLSTAEGRVYRLQLAMDGADGTALDKIEATVMFIDDGVVPYRIQQWNEYTARFSLADE